MLMLINSRIQTEPKSNVPIFILNKNFLQKNYFNQIFILTFAFRF